jgi:hypothetical protein
MRKEEREVEEKNENNSIKPKYKKPKILLIDLPPEITEELRAIGFNVHRGTFGSPYKVERTGGYSPVIFKAELPNYQEQEVIIIDLIPPETKDNPEGEKMNPAGELDWWAKNSSGIIDPRSRVMRYVKDDFDKIFNHGGLFVIFAEPRLTQEMILAKLRSYDNSLEREEKIEEDNWSFLSILSNKRIRIELESGFEMTIDNCEGNLKQFLKEKIKNAHFRATFQPTYYDYEKSWNQIVLNKYGNSVGQLFAPQDHQARILILPQIEKNIETITKLVKEVLPEISPHLFPEIEGQKWVNRHEYEHLKVLEIISKIDSIKKETESQIKKLNVEIMSERQKYDFLHGIITQTGEELVRSVKRALNFIEFANVEEVDKITGNESRQEDLQIHIENMVMLVEVKGLCGFPGEDDTLQVTKYIARRRKEIKDKDIQGISIINHQRNLPPLDRDERNVFTPAQIKDAKSFDFTILTTWDLFRLIRGMMRWGWDPRSIQRLFSIGGRMPCIPTIYEPIGKVSHYYDDIEVVTIEISNIGLIRGQRIGYVTESEFLEEDILSMQINRENIEKAESGQEIGLKTIYSKKQLHKNTLVCVVRSFQ